VSGPLPASTGFTLYVSDFSLQPPSASSAWAPPGGTVNVNPTVTSINLFSSPINVTCSLDVGGTCTGGTVAVSPNGPTPLNLTVSPPAGVSLGTHTLTVTATSGTLTHNLAFPFSIADYSGSLSKSTLTLAQGGSGSLSATVNATAGFAGDVSFACSGATQVTCNFSRSTVQPTASSPQTTNITVTAGNEALKHKSADAVGSRLLPLVFVLPFGIVFGIARKQRRAARAAVGSLLLALFIGLMSCGGGNGSVGGGGSLAYTVTVNASAAGTNTTRTLGTITVIVTN